MPTLIINDFRGINATQASLQLKPGEFEASQNLRARPYQNYARRQGVEPSSVQTSSVLGIFEIDLDNITIPIFQSGGAFQFSPDISSPSNPLPSQFPLDEPLDPGGSFTRAVLFNVEQTMRAIQDRRITAGHSAFTWPNLIFASDGTLLNGATGIAVSSYPANNIYGPDLTYHDIYYGNPTGTRVAALVNQIISCCISTVGFNDWVNTTTGIEGQATVPLLTNTIFPSASSATRSNYSTQLSSCKTGIRKLTTIVGFPTQLASSVETKTGTAQDTGCSSSAVTTISISGFSNTMFSSASCGTTCSCASHDYGCFSSSNWDGSLSLQGSCVYKATFNSDAVDCLCHNGKALCVGTGGVVACNNMAVSYSSGPGAWGFGMTIDSPVGTCSSSSTQTWWSGSYVGPGSDPRGVYVRNAGCATGPASITMI